MTRYCETRHREFRFVKVPDGMPTENCFELVNVETPAPCDGDVLVATRFLSIDPYMRNAMSGKRDYGLEPGQTMIGRGAGVVIESRHPDFTVGDAVQSEFGWREKVLLKGEGLRKLPPDLQPLSLSLGIIGQSAATAWVGLMDVTGLRVEDTVVVSAAAGAVGSAVGQICQLVGARVVGLAGGPDKCRHVVDDLGFSACIDYKAGDIQASLAEALPDGVDVYFDNVGGEILQSALNLMNERGRVVICGQISTYNSTGPVGLQDMSMLLGKGIRIEGLLIRQRLARRDAALDQLLTWWREGKLTWRETVSDGFETAPAAFINMLRGGNIGKQVVRVS